MNLTKILTIVIFLGALAVGYLLYDSIDSTIQKDKEIKRVEAIVKERLELIRDVQIAYQTTYGDYADTWEKLIAYADSGSIFLIQRTETIKMLAYGAEESTITYDTLGYKLVRDSLFKKYQNFDPMTLPELPHAPGKYFSLYAKDSIRPNSASSVDYIEVVDTYPFDITRTDDADIDNRRPLRFGSRTEISTSGNWQ